MKPGDIVKSTISLQPLTKGDQGTVKEVNNHHQFPVIVHFPSLNTTLPMKYDEIKKIA